MSYIIKGQVGSFTFYWSGAEWRARVEQAKTIASIDLVSPELTKAAAVTIPMVVSSVHAVER